MIAKFVIFVALFCSVQASAVRINIFTDADAAEDEVSLPVRNCEDSACDSFCKHLFIGGYCSGDTCMCRINSQAKGLNYKAPLTLPRNSNLGYCDPTLCSGSCQLQNYIGGVCFAGSCICY